MLAPVPHRQDVFSLPKLARPFFRYRRRYLGELCRLVAGLLKTGFEALRHKLLDFLRTEGVLDADITQRMLKWRHSGFSVNNRVHTKAVDTERRQRLSRYMIRCPFSRCEKTHREW